ncbi:MAG: deoxyribonuclease IV [Kiritimatiellae bacterium]|nr:deoxyribonuclease IV [Kiritimatiellia bacterium]
MRLIGPHVSASGSPAAAIANAQAVGATAFALFVKNQRQWIGKPLAAADAQRFVADLQKAAYTAAQVLPHAGYLINLANPDPEMHQKSMGSFLDELHRCEALGLDRLNLHPGSHLNKLSVEAACDRVAESINHALSETQGVTVVIENTAGQGAYLGSKPEELQRIISGVADQSRIGFCIDTAHTFAAGYDLREEKGFERFFDELESRIGLRFLRGMHLNDSKTDLASHHDRHESLGKGYLGWGVFERIVTDARFENVPLILETPDDTLWADEIAHLLNVVR